MLEPKASVLMPVFRTPANYFREAVESILQQTMSDLELIIVEDPSDESCQPEVDRLNDPRIRYVYNEERSGLVSQRNHALSLARGELIVKADSDDISEPHRIETQAKFLAENPDIGAVGSFLSMMDESGTGTGVRPYPTDPQKIRRLFRLRNPIAQPAICFRRQLFVDFGGYPEGYPVCQDYAYWSMLASKGVQFANLDEPLVRYRQHDRSIKSTRLRETLDATIRVKRQYWANELTWTDRMRICAEQSLKYLPPKIVQNAFLMTSVRKNK